MYRNNDFFEDCLNGLSTMFDEVNPFFHIIDSDSNFFSLNNFADIETQNNSNQTQSIIPLGQNSSLQLRDHLNNNFGMDVENPINPPTTGTLSNHQVQPEVIEIEQSSDESQNSKTTKNTSPLEETAKRMNVEFQRNSSQQMEAIQNGNSLEIIPNQIGEQNSSDSSQKTKKNLPHLRMDRRTKGKRNQLQKAINGYWTNNLLRWAKKYHYDWILANCRQRFFKEHPQIFRIFNKVCDKTGRKMEGINMTDYVKIYEEKDLEKCLQNLFSKKVLYRELMLSKADPKVKKVYVKFMSNFERAFRTKKFQFLSKTDAEHLNI